MPLLDNQLARRENGRLELRSDPLRVRWSLSDLASADGHDLRLTFSCSVRALPDPTERRMLAEVLLHDRSAVAEGDVATHFTPALRAAADQVCRARAGESLVSEEGKAALLEALRGAIRPVAFACGVETMAPFQLDVQSQSLQQQRLRAMQRAAAEQHAAGQVQHLQRSAELLKQFQAIREAAPELSAGHVLQRINAADRGAMLQTLLLAGSSDQRRQALWAVAGPYLVKIHDADDGSARPELIPLPPTLGPLRSVQPADAGGGLLIGARSGFLHVIPDSPDNAEPYADPEVTSALGFSRVVQTADGFCACHSEAGVVFWSNDQHEAPTRAVRPGEIGDWLASHPAGTADHPAKSIAPRNLQPLDASTVVFSVGHRILTCGPRGLGEWDSQSAADVVALVPAEQQIYAIHSDGAICGFDRSSGQITCHEKRAARVAAAGGLPWLGGLRFLLADEDGTISCAGLDDDLVTQYHSPHRGLRMVSGSADRVAAVSSDRQRLIVWNSWDGKKPAFELYLAGLTKHRIADVQFA